MILLDNNDWKAKWIEPGYTEDSIQRTGPLFHDVTDLVKTGKNALG